MNWKFWKRTPRPPSGWVPVGLFSFRSRPSRRVEKRLNDALAEAQGKGGIANLILDENRPLVVHSCQERLTLDCGHTNVFLSRETNPKPHRLCFVCGDLHLITTKENN